MSSPEMFFAGCIYGFTRERHTGQGRWIVIHGSCPELVGGDNSGVFVPILFDSVLTIEARERDLYEQHNFSKSLPLPPKPEPRVKGPKKPRARKSGLVGGGLRLSILG